jgi:hypothetical protein
MLSPFSFATESELDHITTLVNALRQARAETQRVREALAITEDKLRDAPWARARNLEAAAARALGESVATPAVAEQPQIDVAELRAQKEGLQQRLASADEREKLAQSTLRSGIHDLLYQCAQRAGERYAQLAAELGQHWQLIYAMETVIGSLQRPVAPLTGWMSLQIPASEYIEAHKRELRYEWHASVLASSDRFAADAQKLSWEVADEGRRLFGEWPL